MKPEEAKQFESVRQWLNAISARGTGSEKTQQLYPMFLSYFLNFVKLTPDELISMAESEPRKLQLLVDDYTARNDKAGLSRFTSKAVINTVRSFLRENDIEIRRIKGPKAFAQARRRTVTKDELKKFMTYASVRLRAFVTVMKDCGMSPIDILKLKYGDIRKGFEAGKAPIQISMIRTKTKVDFDTFLGPDAIKCLNDYLEARKRGTEKIPPETLDDNSPLFRSLRSRAGPVDYAGINQEFQRTRKRAGTEFKVYDLRRFFSTNMKAAGVNDTIAEFWMGHKLPGEKDGYLLSPENQEQIYMSAYPRIAFEEVTLTKETQEQQLLASARLLGIPEDKVAELKAKLGEMKWSTFSDITSEDWKKIIPRVLARERKHARPRSKKKGRKKPTANDCESRYVTEKQLPKFIAAGWEYVAPVNGKILIKKRD
jgi:integrase